MVSGEIIWPPDTGTFWRIRGRVYELTSIIDGIDEAVLTPAASEGRTSEGFKVLREEWEDFVTSATQVQV